jgi:hypothetical protein
MYHCHILDHADGGMMGMVDVGVEDDHQHDSRDVHTHR